MAPRPGTRTRIVRSEAIVNMDKLSCTTSVGVVLWVLKSSFRIAVGDVDLVLWMSPGGEYCSQQLGILQVFDN